MTCAEREYETFQQLREGLIIVSFSGFRGSMIQVGSTLINYVSGKAFGCRLLGCRFKSSLGPLTSCTSFTSLFACFLNLLSQPCTEGVSTCSQIMYFCLKSRTIFTICQDTYVRFCVFQLPMQPCLTMRISLMEQPIRFLEHLSRHLVMEQHFIHA